MNVIPFLVENWHIVTAISILTTVGRFLFWRWARINAKMTAIIERQPNPMPVSGCAYATTEGQSAVEYLATEFIPGLRCWTWHRARERVLSVADSFNIHLTVPKREP